MSDEPVKRYIVKGCTWPHLDYEDPSGQFVKYADFDRVVAERDRLREALRELLEFVDISDCENNDLPPLEYEAIGNSAIDGARAAVNQSVGQPDNSGANRGRP